jgi:hypothetical protein
MQAGSHCSISRYRRDVVFLRDPSFMRTFLRAVSSSHHEQCTVELFSQLHILDRQRQPEILIVIGSQ